MKKAIEELIYRLAEGWDDGLHCLKPAPDGVGSCELCFHWSKCGFTRSFQEIYDSCEWGLDQAVYEAGKEQYIPRVPKQSSHKNLFSFLLSLDL